MKTLGLKGVDSTVLLRFLEQNYANVMSRLWSTDESTGGVFVRSPKYDKRIAETRKRSIRETMALYADRFSLLSESVIVAETDEKTGECTLWISESYYNPDNAHAVSSILEDITMLAAGNGWTVVEPTTEMAKIAGTRCPYCDAIYVYSRAGTVRCHNCNREFEYRPVEKEEKPDVAP